MVTLLYNTLRENRLYVFLSKGNNDHNFQNFGIALESMFLSSTDRCQFADVLFRLDDGVLAAHRAILMARCDMMNAMFAHKGRITTEPQTLAHSVTFGWISIPDPEAQKG